MRFVMNIMLPRRDTAIVTCKGTRRAHRWAWPVGPWLLRIVFLMLALPIHGHASLGGDEGSVQSDRVHMQGALLRITRSDAYTVHEMQAPSGTTVREYVSPSGTVFAVAWQGPRVPDLRQVLGTYFAQYVQSVQAAHRRGHGPLLIQEVGLVVQQSGHPRAFVGTAYVPQLLPPGVGVEAIR
jgi:hypothetical protein